MADPFQILLDQSTAFAAKKQQESLPFQLGKSVAGANVEFTNPWANLLTGLGQNFVAGAANAHGRNVYKAAENEALTALAPLAIGQDVDIQNPELKSAGLPILAALAAEDKARRIKAEDLASRDASAINRSYVGTLLSEAHKFNNDPRVLEARENGEEVTNPSLVELANMVAPGTPPPEQQQEAGAVAPPSDGSKVLIESTISKPSSNPIVRDMQRKREMEENAATKEERKEAREKMSALDDSRALIGELEYAINSAGETGNAIDPQNKYGLGGLWQGVREARLGLNSDKNARRLGGTALLSQLGVDAAAQVRKNFPGQVSNFEMKLYLMVVPGSERSKIANTAYLDRLKRAQAIAEIQAETVAQAVAKGLSEEQAILGFEQYVKQNPLIDRRTNELTPMWKQRTDAILTGGVGKQQPVGGSNVITAPDGQQIELVD